MSDYINYILDYLLYSVWLFQFITIQIFFFKFGTDGTWELLFLYFHGSTYRLMRLKYVFYIVLSCCQLCLVQNKQIWITMPYCCILVLVYLSWFTCKSILIYLSFQSNLAKMDNDTYGRLNIALEIFSNVVQTTL